MLFILEQGGPSKYSWGAFGWGAFDGEHLTGSIWMGSIWRGAYYPESSSHVALAFAKSNLGMHYAIAPIPRCLTICDI